MNIFFWPSLTKDVINTFYFCFRVDSFFSFKLIPIIIKSKYLLTKNFDINKVKEKTKYFESKYRFNDANWFTYNYQIWDLLLSNKEFKSYLEIGSYEGRSAVYIAEKFKNIEINSVDIFKDNDQHKNIEFSKIYKTFLHNMEKLNNKFFLNKTSSDEFFKKNEKKFDLIYIDGAHFFENVYKDFENSFKVLSKKGILICDDFLFNDFDNIQENPISAFMPLLNKYQNEIKILYLNHQLFIKKI